MTFVLYLPRFQGQELDVEFIDTLKQQCRRYIAEKGAATASQLQQVFQSSVSYSKQILNQSRGCFVCAVVNINTKAFQQRKPGQSCCHSHLWLGSLPKQIDMALHSCLAAPFWSNSQYNSSPKLVSLRLASRCMLPGSYRSTVLIQTCLSENLHGACH